MAGLTEPNQTGGLGVTGKTASTPETPPQTNEGWQGIESAPRDRYFLACVMREKSEATLFKAIFGWERDEANYRHVIVASLRPKQRKGRVFMAVTGQPFWATHWMELPECPVFNEKDLPRDY